MDSLYSMCFNKIKSRLHDKKKVVSWDMVKMRKNEIFQLPLPTNLLCHIFLDVLLEMRLKINIDKEEISFTGACIDCGHVVIFEDDDNFDDEEINVMYLFCERCSGPCFIECPHSPYNCNCVYEYTNRFHQ